MTPTGRGGNPPSLPTPNGASLHGLSVQATWLAAVPTSTHPAQGEEDRRTPPAAQLPECMPPVQPTSDVARQKKWPWPRTMARVHLAALCRGSEGCHRRGL